MDAFFLQSLMANQQPAQVHHAETDLHQSNILRTIQLSAIYQQFYRYRLQQLLLQQAQHQSTSAMELPFEPPPSPPASTTTGGNSTPEPFEDYSDAQGFETNVPTCVTEHHPSPAVIASSPQPQRSSRKRTSSSPETVLFKPHDLQRRPMQLSAVQAITAIEVDMAYHGNMARHHEPKPSTPEERRKRELNTHAARISRAKVRALQTLLEKECNEATEQNQSRKLMVARNRAYVNELNRLLGLPERNLAAEWHQIRDNVEQTEH